MQLALTILILVVAVAVLVAPAPVVLAWRAGRDADTKENNDA